MTKNERYFCLLGKKFMKTPKVPKAAVYEDSPCINYLIFSIFAHPYALFAA